MPCIPEKIIDKNNALVCNFAKNPDAGKRTARLSKTIKNVSTYVCDWHAADPKRLPKEWR